MKPSQLIKILALSSVSLGLFAGCASTTEPAAEEPTEPQPQAQEPAPQPEEKAPEPMVTETAATSMGQYEVTRGDNLWDISAKPEIYANPYQWPLIYKANSAQIKDADLIYPGQVLDIDTNPSASEVDAAVQHARTRGSWSLGVVEESDKAYLSR